MMASADAAYMARRAADFGVTMDDDVSVDMRRVKERKDVNTFTGEGLADALKGAADVGPLSGGCFTAIIAPDRSILGQPIRSGESEVPSPSISR